jgi:hypothetical protein
MVDYTYTNVRKSCYIGICLEYYIQQIYMLRVIIIEL